MCYRVQIHRELYFAILMDRAFNGPVLVASTQGGMDIEEVGMKRLWEYVLHLTVCWRALDQLRVIAADAATRW